MSIRASPSVFEITSLYQRYLSHPKIRQVVLEKHEILLRGPGSFKKEKYEPPTFVSRMFLLMFFTRYFI